MVIAGRVRSPISLESVGWNPVLREAASLNEAPKEQNSRSVFKLDNGDSFFVPGSGDRCLQGREGVYFPAKVNKDWNFRFVPLKVPYAIMWYGIYGLLLDIDAYVGAEEIDKCLVWLLLVSALTEASTKMVLGPAVVDEDP